MSRVKELYINLLENSNPSPETRSTGGEKDSTSTQDPKPCGVLPLSDTPKEYTDLGDSTEDGIYEIFLDWLAQSQ
jgi:hypothetical protein